MLPSERHKVFPTRICRKLLILGEEHNAKELLSGMGNVPRRLHHRLPAGAEDTAPEDALLAGRCLGAIVRPPSDREAVLLVRETSKGAQYS